MKIKASERMSRKNSYIVLLLICIVQPLMAENSPAKLSIRINGKGLILIDSVLIAKNSLYNLNMAPGSYRITVLNGSNTNWVQRGFDELISIEKGESKTIELDLPDNYYINSIPYGSKVYTDDVLLGSTPLFLQDYEILSTKIRLKLKGYRDTVLDFDKQTANYMVRLKKIDQAKTAGVSSWYGKKKNKVWLKNGLIISSVLSSWAAFYFKRQANEYHNKYGTAADSRLIQQYWDQTRKYDSLSEISLGISVTSVGALIYLLIFE